MGIEGSGAPKTPVQGEAGYLTQDQLDELNTPAVETSEIAEPEESDLFNVNDMQRVSEALGGASTPEVVEAGPEVMEQIGEQEQKLGANLKENAVVLQAAEARIAAVDPRTLEEGALLKYRVMKEKVNNAYSKVQSRLNGLLGAGLVGGLGATAVSAWTAVQGHQMISNLDVSGYQLMDLSEKIGGGGLTVAAATAAVWAVGRSINWLAKRSGEKKAEQEWSNNLSQTA